MSLPWQTALSASSPLRMSAPALLTSRVGLYADAVRNMQPRQLAFRARRLVPPSALAVKLPVASGVSWRRVAHGVGIEVAPPSGPQPPPHQTGRFVAVGAECDASDQQLWTDQRDGLLFLFHLHGFSDLARYVAGPRDPDGDRFWTEVLERWLLECGRPSGVAWHPYPLSGRLLAWCAALSEDGWGEALRERMETSVRLGTAFLARGVEYDVGGNHVLRNGAALVVAAGCAGDERSLRAGIRVLERELPAQFLPDGGHEERSPSYHRAALSDLTDAATVLERIGRDLPVVRETIARGRAWLSSLATPWGELPVLNDGWDGPALSTASELPVLNDGWDGPALSTAAKREAFTDLSASGYLVLTEGDAHAVLDVAPVAPAHLPAHAHADVLSFVLWSDGRPVVVDPGSGRYTGPERAISRATRSHSTVEVDALDQCEFWGPFRAAFMPRVARGPVLRRKGATTVTASHDGYRRLSDPVRHTRTFVWLGQAGMVVVDRLDCSERHGVVSRIPLAEGLSAAEGTVLPGGIRLRGLGGLGRSAPVAAWRAPYLGTELPIEMAELRGSVEPGQRFGWSLLREGYEAHLSDGILSVSGPGLDLGLPT
jgi:hypothetical protein